MKLEVIGSGLGRTGTMSLQQALQQLLGGSCFHMVELLKKPERLKYLKAGYKSGNTDWTTFFEGYKSAVDYPICLYVEELLKSNPKLKVIHTTRDPETWYNSVYNTIYRGVPKGPKDIFRLIFNTIRYKDMRRVAPVFMHNDKLIWKGQFENRFEDRDFAIEVFKKHEEQIKQLVPGDQLLIFNVKDGWEPLCNFLGVAIPDAPFPQTNQKDEFNRKMDRLLVNGVFEA